MPRLLQKKSGQTKTTCQVIGKRENLPQTHFCGPRVSLQTFTMRQH